MGITYVRVLVFCTLVTVSLLIGYLADTLFDKQWYGYLLVGAALSCFLHFNTLPGNVKPLANAHPYLRIFVIGCVLLIILTALGFLGKVIFGIDFYKPLFFGALMTFVAYNGRKTKIKKQ